MERIRRGVSGFPAAAFSAWLAFALCDTANAAVWGCHGTKPGHPTAEERARFIGEAGALAIHAERRHGVPAAALVAMAIAESGYGYTRMAIEANNLFAWKTGRAATQAGKAYVPPCGRRADMQRGFMIFESRAHAFEHVAARLASYGPYRDYTAAYVAARKRGEPVQAAVDAWLDGIAQRYSSRPEVFAQKIRRIMNDPEGRGDTLSPETNLYRLSVDTGGER